MWGAAYGVLLIIERLVRGPKPLGGSGGFRKQNPATGHQPLATITTFIIVTILWSVFRAPSFEALGNLYIALFQGGGTEHLHAAPYVWVALAAFIALDIVLRKTRFDAWCSRLAMPLRWGIYAVMIFSIIVFSSVEQYPFIYFQF